MGSNTPHHSFYLPNLGETGWGDDQNQNWSTLDELLLLRDTSANRPAPGTVDRWFLETDSLGLYYDDGSAWQDVLAEVGNADTLDGDHFDDRLANQRSFDIASGSGEEYFKIAQLSYADGGGNIDVNALINLPSNGPTAGAPCHTRVYANGRTTNQSGEIVTEWSQFGPETPRGEVVLTQDSNDNVHLYIRATSFLQTTVRVEHGKDVGSWEFQGGLAEADLVGTIIYDMGTETPNFTAAFGDLSQNGNSVLDASDEGSLDAGTLGGESASAFADAGHSHAHADLTSVSTDDHHAKYTDAEATSAVGGSTPWANAELVNSAVTIAGNSVSLGGSTGIAHADIAGIGADDHHAKYTDAEAVTAVNNDADHGSTASHNYFSGSHADLSSVSADDHHAKYTDAEATTAVGGSVPWANADLSNSSITVAGNSVALGGSTGIAHADLADAPSGAHHAKYTDSEAVSAVNAETTLSVDISGDAETLDGNDAVAFARSDANRQTPNAHLPITALDEDEYVEHVVYVPSGYTFTLWMWGLNDDSAGMSAPADCVVLAKNSSGTTITFENTVRTIDTNTGIFTVSGEETVRLRLKNEAVSSVVNLAAYFSYSVHI